MVQPSGPNNHFWIRSGSVCARYTASGGAANRLVTTTYRSPSVFNVNLLIVFHLLFLVSSQQGPCLTCRNFSLKPPAAWQAIGRLPQHPPAPAGTDASCPRLDG